MADSWTLVTPVGDYQLNPSFSAPKYEAGGVAAPGAVRRDARSAYQRSGDGLATPGPLVLAGRVWRDNHDAAAMVAELNHIRAAVESCISVVRENNAGTYTYDDLAGGPTPEIYRDGLGGWEVHIELWPGRAAPSFVPIAGLGAPVWNAATNYGAPIGLNWESGWRFIVGANPLTAAALMLYSAAGGTENVNIWRVSDQQLLRSVPVTAPPGDWGETPIEPLVLEAGASYVISRFSPDGVPLAADTTTRQVQATSNLVTRPIPFDPGITFDGRVTNSNTSAGGFPTGDGGSLTSVNFKTTAPAGGYRFIRFNVLGGNGDLIRFNRIWYRSAPAGPDITTEAKAVFENSFNVATNASNQLYVTNATDWITAAGVTAAWSTLDFGVNNKKTIAEYDIRVVTQGNRAPKDWVLEGSNDLIIWHPIHTVTNETGWSNNETRTFTV